MPLPNARARLALAGALLLGLTRDPCLARAAPVDPVAAAERAYEQVDFDAQLAEATRALAEGGHDPARLADIYRLLGIAHAALGAHDAAKQDFMRLLAIDPDVALERALSPRLRTPYLEARGFWDVSRSRLELRLALDAASGALRIGLGDPLQMGQRVRVVAGHAPRADAERDAADEPRTVAELAAAPELVIDAASLAPHAGRPLEVELLDAHANVLVARQLTAPRPSAPARATSPAPPRKTAASEAPSTPTLSLVLGGSALLALGAGATAHMIRESKATEWNGAGCEQPGRGSRSEQCGHVDAQRRSAQTVAVVGYAAAGALVAASVVSYLSASEPEHEPDPAGSLAIGLSPYGWGLSCQTAW